MDGCFWKALLVVGALTIGGGSSLPHKPLTFVEAVDLAVSIYNNRSGEKSLYRPLEPVSPPDWDPLSQKKQELNFTLMETVCQVAKETSWEQCDLREDGVVKECRGYFFFGESPPVLVLTCEPVDEEEEEKEKEVEKEEKDEEGDEEEKEVEKEEKEGDKKGQPRRVKRFKKFWRKIKNSVKKRAKKLLKKPTVIGVSIPF